MIVIDIKPKSAPRLTYQGRFKKEAKKYHEYKNELRLKLNKIELPQFFHIHFMIPMPKSWSKKKRANHMAQLHMYKPDTDNLLKAFIDSLPPSFFEKFGMNDDKFIAYQSATKWWTEKGCVIIEEKTMPIFPNVKAEHIFL